MADRPTEPSARERGPGSVSGLGATNARLQDRSTPALIDELLRRLAGPLSDQHRFSSGHEVSHAGWLAQELAIRATGHENHFGIQRTGLLLSQLQEHPGFSFEFLQGADCLELGCGGLNPLAGMLTLLAAGAARCAGMNLEQPASLPAAARGLHDCAVALLAGLIHPDLLPSRERIAENLRDVDLDRLARGEVGGVPHDRLFLAQRPADDTGLPDQCCDLLTSDSFLEHVDDLDALFVEMRRISRPGALGVHAIDGTDHRHYRDPEHGPLEFLTVDSDDRLLFGCNRERPLQVAERMRRHGFEVVTEPREHFELSAAFRVRLAPRYAALSDEELSVTRALIFTTAPA